ncbi:hypothetical protein TWF703_006037 [Orbilia oligospora]|uniref:Uncharacterized protein n=1 Tax=Orbilia oligospora TaxID=2813651 RepID=A0A7C8JRS3_ORBOL|nr:hypothetical protein TWF703_006037 [Orbilia oligospora]
MRKSPASSGPNWAKLPWNLINVKSTKLLFKMQATLRAPNLFITFFLILLAVVQPLIAAPVEITKDTQCSGSKECIKEADNIKFHAANTVKSKYIPRSAPTTNTRKLKKRSQLATQLKKRAVPARERK